MIVQACRRRLASFMQTLGHWKKWLRIRFLDHLSSIFRPQGLWASLRCPVQEDRQLGAAEDTGRQSDRVNSENDEILDFFHGLRIGEFCWCLRLSSWIVRGDVLGCSETGGMPAHSAPHDKFELWESWSEP